jgi:hypothetical protein
MRRVDRSRATAAVLGHHHLGMGRGGRRPGDEVRDLQVGPGVWLPAAACNKQFTCHVIGCRRCRESKATAQYEGKFRPRARANANANAGGKNRRPALLASVCGVQAAAMCAPRASTFRARRFDRARRSTTRRRRLLFRAFALATFQFPQSPTTIEHSLYYHATPTAHREKSVAKAEN